MLTEEGQDRGSPLDRGRESCDDEKPGTAVRSPPDLQLPQSESEGRSAARPGRPMQSRARRAGPTEGVRSGPSATLRLLVRLHPLPPPLRSPRSPSTYLVLCVDLHARVCEEGGHDRGVPIDSRPVQRGAAMLQGRGEGEG